MFDPILDSIKENDKQLKEQQHIQLATHSQEQKPKNSGYVKDSGDETSSDIPERIDIQNEQIRSGYGLNNGNNNVNSNNTQEKKDHGENMEEEEEEDDDDLSPVSCDYIISYFKNNLLDVISLPDGSPLTRKQSYFSLIRKLLLVKTGMFPNVLELFQLEYTCKKKPLYKGLEKNYMYEKNIGEHLIHYDLRYNLKTEHINYMSFLGFSLLSSKSISKINKEKLLSDPYFAFATVYQIILYNFNILNMYNTFHYNTLNNSLKKKFHPLIELDLDSDRDSDYNIASINYHFKPDLEDLNKNDVTKTVQEKPMVMEQHKIKDYLWKIPFGEDNYKNDEVLKGHPQAEKLNGFQVLFFLNKWCQSNGSYDHHGIAPLVYEFIALLERLEVKMKKENQIVALILWLTAMISYSKEDDMEFQENILRLILDDPSFIYFDELNYNTSFNEEELQICQREALAREELRESKGLSKKQQFDLIINQDGDLEVLPEQKILTFHSQKKDKESSEKINGKSSTKNIVLVKNQDLMNGNDKSENNKNNNINSKKAGGKKHVVKEEEIKQEENDDDDNEEAEEDYEEEFSDDEENNNNFKIENNSCVNYTDYYDPKHIINVTNTKSKNNFKKQLNKEITVKLNNLYKDKTIDQLIYDLGETQRIAYKLRTGSSNYMKLFDKHEVNYVALTSGKFGGRTKKNPKINDSVLGFQTDMVKLFRMNKKLLLKRASRMFAEKDLINKE